MLLLKIFDKISGKFLVNFRKRSKGRKNKLKGRTLAMSAFDLEISLYSY